MTLNHDADMEARWEAFTRRLFQQNRFAIKLGLDSMNRALHMCGRAALRHRVVLVAGTNGKGTTASCLSSLLTAAGVKVGFYSSPHLIDFTERFRIEGEIVSSRDVLAVGEPILERFASPESSPCLTFFELTTLIAVELFEQAGVDVAIYEVGLGGRLDATNALEPDLCVLTSIGYDHQQYLGDTLESIASEKLGILREGVPLVVSRQDHRAVDTLLTTLAHTPLHVFGRNFGMQSLFDPEVHPLHHSDRLAHELAAEGVEARDDEAEPLDTIWWYSKGERRTLSVKRWGMFQRPYQRAHLATALVAADHVLRHWSDQKTWLDTFQRAIPRISWPGRMQTVSVRLNTSMDGGERGEGSSPCLELELLCDAAHNADGVSALFDALEESAYRPDVILCSFLADKDASSMLARFGAWLDRCEVSDPEAPRPELYAVVLDNPRASSARALEHAFADQGVTLEQKPAPIHEVVSSIASMPFAAHTGRVLVFGSMYLLGELWSALECEDVALAPLLFEEEGG